MLEVPAPSGEEGWEVGVPENPQLVRRAGEVESEESHTLGDESTGTEGPESSEFEIDGEQYVALKKSDFVQYEETVELAHQMMLDCVERIFKAFKAIPRQPVVPPLPPQDKM